MSQLSAVLSTGKCRFETVGSISQRGEDKGTKDENNKTVGVSVFLATRQDGPSPEPTLPSY